MSLIESVANIIPFVYNRIREQKQIDDNKDRDDNKDDDNDRITFSINFINAIYMILDLFSFCRAKNFKKLS